jgi:hypothetical protein
MNIDKTSIILQAQSCPMHLTYKIQKIQEFDNGGGLGTRSSPQPSIEDNSR